MAVTNNFSSSSLDLNGMIGLGQPTALVWGPDGRLYITEVDGDVKVLTVAFGDKNLADDDATAQFYVTEATTVDLIKGAVQNHNDDGTEVGGNNRQVTGIDVTTQYDENGAVMTLADGTPMVTMYVTSSDNRIGAGGGGNDAGLDTNSGVITMMTQTGPDSWTAIDLVRGLPRSEENHATNGLEIIQEFAADGVTLISERMIVANGGNANTGAPSNNFAGQQEQPLSAAILEIDLTMLKGMPVLDDDGRAYVYDIPTLNDPSRTDGVEGDTNDPFGGNDGRNSAKLLEDGPISIYSSGYRNAYDVEVTDDGRVWTYDNGANNSWGGRPIGEAGDNGGTTDNAQSSGYISTNLNNGDGNTNDDINLENWNPSNQDNFHEVTRSDDLNGGSLSVGGNGPVTTFVGPDGQTYVYGGHPNPTRAEGATAGLLFSPDAGTDNAYLLVSGLDTYNDDGDDNPLTNTDYDQVIAWLSAVEANNADFPSGGNAGANTGDLTKKVLAVTPGVLYEIYSFSDGSGQAVPVGGAAPAGGTLQGTAGIPEDIAEIVAYRNKVEGDYKEAGKTDGALDTGGGSINGLAEYTSTILDVEGGTKMSGAILATQLGGGNIIVMGRNADGTMSSTVSGSGFAVAADRTVIGANGGPLGISTIGDDYLERGLSQPFQGSIWTAVYNGFGAPSIEIFQPNNGAVPLAGSEIVNPTDRDLDGVDYISDPFEFSDDNGYAIAPGEKIVLDFNPQNTNFTISIGGTGLLGAALDGVTPNTDAQTEAENFPVDQQLDGLYDIGGNVLPGGNAPILQIKKVIEGTVVGTANSARDVLHTGILPSADTDRIVATMSMENWVAGQGPLAAGQLSGMIFGDGTQKNFMRVVFGAVDLGSGVVPGIEVGFEIGDANYTIIEQIALPGLSSVAVSTLELRLTIDKENGFAVGVDYRLEGEANFTALDLGGFVLPEGVLRDVLTGQHTIGEGAAEATSGAAIGFLAETSEGNVLETVDFYDLTIEAFGNEIAASTAAAVGAAGSANVDTIIYDGTETDLAPLAADVENFDGSGSAAGYMVTGNALNNVIKVGTGANTITTGAGSDSVQGTVAQLSGDTITDFSQDDELIINGVSVADLSITYEAGSAVVVINGVDRITFTGPDFEDFAAADGPDTFTFEDTPGGVRLVTKAALTPVIAINSGGPDVNGVTVRDQVVNFVSDLPAAPKVGFNVGTTYNAYTNGAAQGTDFPDTELDGIHAYERSGNFPVWSYNIDVPDGEYLVDLYFAEIFHGVQNTNNPAGLRTFDLEIEGTLVLDDYDIISDAGASATEVLKTYQVTVTDGQLNLDFIKVVDQAKLSGLVVWSIGGTFVPPADETAPEITGIFFENPPSDQDSPRDLVVTLQDNAGFDAADFAGLTGAELTFTGIEPATVGAPTVAISADGLTATVTYELTAPGGSWPAGEGAVSIDAAAYGDTAGNTTAAASSAFFVVPNLDNLVAGEVALAINVGPTANTLDATLAGDDKNTYGGAITGDTIINGINLQADDVSYYAPTTKTGSNIDGKAGTTGSNTELDGSALHTYRDAASGSFTATYPIENGVYVIELWFAELFHATGGQRQGDYTINGEVLELNFDAFTAAGGADTAVSIRKNVIVTDGQIVIDVNADTGQPGFNAIVVYDAVPSDLPSTVSVADVSTVEGEDATITFSRIGDLSEDVTVTFTLANGTADGDDFGAPTPVTVTILANQTSATATVPITNDEDEEAAETFTVTITGVTNTADDAMISASGGTATITIAASDPSTGIPAGGALFDLDFEGVTGEALAVGGFDGVLGAASNLDETTSEVTGGKLVVQTSEGDINDANAAGNTGSGNDFTKTVDVSDPALTELFLTSRFDNPFTAAVLAANGITNGTIPNYVQQGIVLGTGTQNAGEMVKLVWGGVAAGFTPGDSAGVQLWSKGGVADQSVAIAQMIEAGKGLFDVASVELSLELDRGANTVGQWVTLYDATGTIIGGVRPEATDGFFTVAPVAIPPLVLANLNDPVAPTHFGVTSSDNSTPVGGFVSFEAAWDNLSLTSPQFVAVEQGPDAVGGTVYGDFSDDGLAPTDIGDFANGSNVITAQQVGDAGPRDRDYFTFEVPEGQVLNAINLTSYVNEEPTDTNGFIAIQRGGQVTFDPTDPSLENQAAFADLLGGMIYGSGELNNDILATMAEGGLVQGAPFPGFDLPLEAGTYTIWMNQGAALPTTVTLDFVLADRPVDVSLSIADAGDVTENGDFGATVVAFDVTASDSFDGTLTVTYDTATETGLTQEVTFVGGVGTITVTVANDNVQNGAETVSVTLISAVDAVGTSTVAISGSSDSGSGRVVEDDGAGDVTKGAAVFALNVNGPEITATDGVVYEADSDAGWANFNTYVDGGGGQPVLASGDYDRDGDTDADDALYSTERWGGATTPLTYTKTGLPAGEYIMTLKFAELFNANFTATGRVFSVTVNGEEVVTDLNLFNIPGLEVDQAYDVDVPVTIGADGNLNMSFTASTDNAAIKAFALYEAVTAGTPTDLTVSVTDVVAAEESQIANVIFTRDGDTTSDVVITFAVADGTGVAGTDYVTPDTTVTILAGETTATVPVTLIDNADQAETPKTFTVTITDVAPAGGESASLGVATATVTIDDDEAFDPLDIDLDGILNVDDPFAYDEDNGLSNVLTVGGIIRQDFDTPTDDPFSAEGGFTGILVNPAFNPGGTSGTDPYGDRTVEEKVTIADGRLSVTSSNEDSYLINNISGNNTMRDGYQSAVDVSGVENFEVHARASSADFAGRLSANGFVQFGIQIGAGGLDDFVKFVISDGGNGTPRVQIGNNQSLTVGTDLNYAVGGPGPTVDLSQVGDIDFRIIVDKVAGTLVGQIDFFAATGGALLTSFTTPPATILAGSAFDLAMQGLNPLTGGVGGMAYGINVTDSGGSNDPANANFNQITVDYDFLTIRGLDNAPTVDAGIAPQTATENTAIDFTLPLDVFADDGGVANLTLTAVAVDGDGLDAALPAWLTFDPATGTFSGTPADGDGGVTIKVTADDGTNPPVFTTFDLTVDDIPGPFLWYADADGDGVGTSADQVTEYVAPEGYVSADAGDDADDADATVYPGAPEINDTLDNDQDGLIDEDNLAPVTGADPRSVQQDTPVLLTVADLLVNDSDPDGDTLTFDGVSNEVNGTVAYDGLTGDITFTPTPGFFGAASFDYTVSDGFGGVTLQTVEITIGENLAPTVDAGIAPQAATENTAIDFTLPLDVFADDNGVANLTLSATLADDSPLPEWLTFAGATFTGTPPDGAGVLAIKVTADDGTNPPVSTTFDLTVEDIPGPFIWYADADGDGVGTSTDQVTDYVAPGGYVSADLGDDADDTDATVYPGAPEINDGKDNNQNGEIDEDNVVPVVGNDDVGPVRNRDVSFTRTELLSNDSDGDGDTLSFALVPGSGVNGTVSLNDSTGVVTFTPTAGYTGPASFQYTVSDPFGGTATQTVNIAFSADAGVTATPLGLSNAGVSSYTTSQDAQPNNMIVDEANQTVTMAGNAWKKIALPDGNLVITEGMSLKFTVNVSTMPEILGIGFDNDQNFRNAGTAVFQIGGGQIIQEWNQQFKDYTPAMVGTDVTMTLSLDAFVGQQFSNIVFINDQDAGPLDIQTVYSNIEIVSTALENVRPVAAEDNLVMEADAFLIVSNTALLANDTDPEGDAISITSVGEAVNGTVTLLGNAVRFDPDSGYTGLASFEYTITDAAGGTSTTTVDIVVLPEGGGDVPTPVNFNDSAIESYDNQDAKPGTGFTIADGGASITLDGNVWKKTSLPESYVITENTVLRFDFTALNASGEIVGIGLENDNFYRTENDILFQIAGGQNFSAWANTALRGSYTGAGAPQFYEIDLSAYAGQSFSKLVLINDDDGSNDSLIRFANVALVEVIDTSGNDTAAPQIFNGILEDQMVTEDAPFEIDLAFFDTDTPFGDLTFTFEGLPGFATEEGGVLIGEAGNADVGSYDVSVTATDPEGNAVTGTFTLVVENVNDAPEVVGIYEDVDLIVNSEVNLVLPAGVFVDIDAGTVLQYAATGLPEGLVIDPATGTISGTPVVFGDFDITITAYDGDIGAAGTLSVSTTFGMDIASGPPRETVFLEAEDFTAFTDPDVEFNGFYRTFTAAASGQQLIRLPVNGVGSISTKLDAAGVSPGFYDISVIHFDENDGVSSFTLKLDLGDGNAPTLIGTYLMDRTDLPGQGNGTQAANITSAVFPTVNIPAGAQLIIEGIAQPTPTSGREVVRIDAVRFDPVDNTPPTIDTPATATVDEGSTAVLDVNATDLEGSDITYEIVGGDDAALFEIDAVTGQVSFLAAPDFETPLDLDGDNVYDVIVSASDGGAASEQTLAITVANVEEAPVFTGDTAITVNENDSAVTTVAAVDPDGNGVTYALAGTAADEALFAVDPVTGVVTFLTVPDFETPLDADLDGVYDVSITANDGTSSTTTDLSVTVADINDAPVAVADPAPQPVIIDAPLALDITGLFSDQDAGDTLTYSIVSGAPAGITGIVDGVLTGTPTAIGLFNVVISATDGIAPPVETTLTLNVDAADNTFGRVAPSQDLDQDGTINSLDDDVDEDGLLNAADSFAYDADNGTLIADGESIDLTFDVDGTPYQNGFTGLLQAGLVGTSALKDFNEDTGNTSVAGGLLTTTTTTGDTGTTDTPEDDFQLGVKNADFTVEARVLNPFQNTPAVSFSQIGVHVGVDSTDFVKFVFGNQVEFSTRTNNVEAKVSGGNQTYPDGVALGDFASVDITLTVNSTSATAATVSAVATFLDAAGNALPGGSGISFGSASISGALAAALADETVGVGTGFTHVHAGNGVFDAQLDSFKVTATGGGSIDPANALAVFGGEDDIFTGSSYGTDAVGAGLLSVMTGNNNVQSSNFGANSFQLTNTGDKKIAAVFIDVSGALYQDSVFDPDGAGGDNATKDWGINSGGPATGAFITGGTNGYFLAGTDPLANDTGTGQASNGGFKGAIIKFTDFDNGETVGFSGDMDPNSIAGLDKNGTAGVDVGATNGWDVGGISGHEIIGSTFTILFDDGTTASGQLASDGSAAGSQGQAVENAEVVDAPTLVVNGFAAGEVGTYGVDQPTILVTGDPGATVRITMTKGFDPVENTTGGIDALVTARLDRYDFKASNAFDVQTVDVVLDDSGTFDATGLFDYDDTLSNGGTFAGSDVADIGFVASVIDTGNNNLSVSPVTKPIYLTNVGGPVVGDPAGNDGGTAEEIFAGEADLITSASYTNGETGAAVLDIMVGSNNIEDSNYGANSFKVTNTGDKKISAVFIDVSNALYEDSVFDPDGKGGDNVAKAWAVNSAGGTGAYISGGTGGYFIPGQNPLANTTGTGQESNGGFKGAIVKFTDFNNGETVGFSGDMDPNSLAGLTKASVDGSAIDSWDVGGVSGHELIGSRFTVLFDDGTTASGQLASDGSASGSQALASQALTPATTPTLTVNGVGAGGTGTYGGTQPTIIVTGDEGDTVRITMTKGFNPVIEPANGIGQLVTDRLDRYDFKANNNFDSQTVDVVIGAGGTFDATGLFDYDDAVANNKGDGTFTGDDVAQIGFVASVIDTANNGLAISAVTAPIILTNQGGPVVGDPEQPFEGYFEIIGSGNNARFKIQVEDANGTGGTTPPGDWTYATAPDGAGNQSGFQGAGYYIWKEGATEGTNAPQGILEYEIFIPEGEEGVYSFRARGSRDPGTPSDQANDIWLKIDDDAEALQTNGTDSVSSGGFVKVFGTGTGGWGNTGTIDSVSEEEGNFKASFELSAGFHTISIAGRSGGYAIDSFDLYKGTGGFPASGASNSNFVTEAPVDPGTPGTSDVYTIAASSDDWEQFGGGGSADLEFGLNGQLQSVGLRFTGINIPEDSVIAEAYFQFEANGSDSVASNFTIEIENTESAATYSTTNDQDDRTYLDDDFDWNDVEVWTDGNTYTTPRGAQSLADLIEAVIGTDGVFDGELAFRITGTGARAAHSFDSDGDAPELVIVFEPDVA